MPRPKRPKMGDVVTAYVGLDDRPVTGVVDWIGSVMFAIQFDDTRELILCAQEWEKVDETV